MANRHSSRRTCGEDAASPRPACSATRIAAVRKSVRGLSGPTIRCSSGQVLTVTRPRAAASRSAVSPAHR
ncbi:hypothetical protein [Actinomadura keratinilytica]|uniref:hypothetical protein n=1 Tax=Actinomadura keratinilytica TaxID=547461 RepID=UPI00360AA970